LVAGCGVLVAGRVARGGRLRRVGVCVGEPLNDAMGVSLRHTAFLRFRVNGEWGRRVSDGFGAGCVTIFAWVWCRWIGRLLCTMVR
jgi:hypothetical protein